MGSKVLISFKEELGELIKGFCVITATGSRGTQWSDTYIHMSVSVQNLLQSSLRTVVRTLCSEVHS